MKKGIGKYFLYSLLIHLLFISGLIVLLVEFEYITFSAGSGGNFTEVSVYKSLQTENTFAKITAEHKKNMKVVQKEHNRRSVENIRTGQINETTRPDNSKKRYKINKNSSKISKVTINERDNVIEKKNDIKIQNETESGGIDYREGENIKTVAVPEYGINPKPEYPLSARRRGYEGEVVFRVLVLDNGDVGDLEILKTSGFEILDNSAHTALQEWKFIPGKLNGRSVSSWVKVPILFRLNNI